MKTLSALLARTKNNIQGPTGFLIAAALAFVLCFTTVLAGAPPPPQCTVCHKRTQTQTYDCSSLDYQRHLDHGDPAMACPSSRSEEEPSRARK